MNTTTLLENAADVKLSFPLWPEDIVTQISDAFTFDSQTNLPSHAIVRSVTTPYLLGFPPKSPSNQRVVLLLAGGGYTELHIGREGIQVAQWLCGLGFTCFVLVHRFPNTHHGVQAPIDDARQALRVLKEKGFGERGVGVCGLSSGGHLAAGLMCPYPRSWTERGTGDIPEIHFMVVGYAPISTNAVGRQIVLNKPALAPPQKQGLYDIVQPDVHLGGNLPRCFIVYSASDSVVPVVNAYRLAQGLGEKGATVELHVFADAPHGFGIDTVGLPVTGWVAMCEAWMRQCGLLQAEKAK